MLKTIYENVQFTGDTILELDFEFVSGTVTCNYITNTLKTEVPVTVLGGKFISLSLDVDSIPPNTVLNISYKIKEEFSKLSEFERIKELESRINDHEKVLKEVLEALKYRVDIQAFKVWIKSLEKELGVDLVQQQFSLNR